MTERKYYTINRFGAVFEHGRTKTYELIKAGELKTVKAGARTLITAESAEAYSRRLHKAAGISIDALEDRDDCARLIEEIVPSAIALIVKDSDTRNALLAVISAPSSAFPTSFFRDFR